MACLVGQWTCATARHRRDVSVHAPSNRGASYQSPEQTRSQVQKPTMRSRTENAVTPSETPIPSVKYVFIVEPKVGGGSSYICCCCCCGRSGGGGAAYFAGGGGGGAGGAGAGGRGPAEAVRQAVRRAAVVRAAAADGAARRAATRPCRSSVRLPRASIFVLCFDRWQRSHLNGPATARFAAAISAAGKLRRHCKRCAERRDGLACVDTLEFAGSPDAKPGYACSKELTA